MNPITLAEFFMGRDVTYASSLTPAITTNGIETVRRANQLLDRFYSLSPNAHRRGVNSGWRPPAVNAGTAGASPTSHHMTGRAVDIGDDDEQLDVWCMTPIGQLALAEFQLWLEFPGSTPRWCHVQTVPPGSGNRVFHP